MEKIKLTVEQEVALKDYKDFKKIRPLQTYLALKDTFTCEYKSLVNFTPDEFARLLYVPDSYEVEETFKEGRFFTYPFAHSNKYRIGELKGAHVEWCDGLKCDINYVRLLIESGDVYSSTPEEIKTEKERRVWKSIGREVGEFTEADIGIDRAGNIRDGKVDLEHYYKNGTLVRLYPAESFISFGGGEE